MKRKNVLFLNQMNFLASQQLVFWEHTHKHTQKKEQKLRDVKRLPEATQYWWRCECWLSNSCLIYFRSPLSVPLCYSLLATPHILLSSSLSSFFFFLRSLWDPPSLGFSRPRILKWVAISFSLLFFTLVIYTQCLNFLYGISYRLLLNEWPQSWAD